MYMMTLGYLNKRLVHCTAPPPGPPTFTGTKLMDDEDRPWKPLQSGDQRVPCPGLKVLASHGGRLGYCIFAQFMIVTHIVVPPEKQRCYSHAIDHSYSRGYVHGGNWLNTDVG
ncbi:hypothetical protein FA15DRAFT_660651 [Coprinopsis marcescibilis]|uniref:Heme haloperoxidase family profile domain-containing protein n=1 Tax=Coprinopsis marcescibilis TaxID=230819 RepID=A0A5C3KES2_COPMA|nr:hypothetical protein FA15DRAFT_660651 [Coprinopsis marcescibilis]